MDATFIGRISQFLTQLQTELFPVLREDLELELSPALEKVIRVLEFVQVERFIPSNRGFVGAPPKDREALARAFVAKTVLNLPTTEGLIDRLKVDHALRRICGFDSRRKIPGAWRFSRAFAEFAAGHLPARVHEALIGAHLGDQLVGHIARDSTEIEAREKPAKPAQAAAAEDKPAKPRGRPKQGEERVKAPTRRNGQRTSRRRKTCRNYRGHATSAPRPTARALRKPGSATSSTLIRRMATSRSVRSWLRPRCTTVRRPCR